ncbi:MAG: hypothetical protein GVY30_00100 [Chloroflexi bacterium]|jgi:hypothetical protein|nr:hypothetical protein [Chloroflexota bacterium]
MKIRDLTHTEWKRALREDDAQTLDRCWFNFDRDTPELHDRTPADLRPYLPTDARRAYATAIVLLGMTALDAWDIAISGVICEQLERAEELGLLNN